MASWGAARATACEGRSGSASARVETLINVRVAKAGLIVHEVPSFEQVRLYGETNLHTVRDGSRILRTIVRERLSTAAETSILPRIANRLLGS